MQGRVEHSNLHLVYSLIWKRRRNPMDYNCHLAYMRCKKQETRNKKLNVITFLGSSFESIALCWLIANSCSGWYPYLLPKILALYWNWAHSSYSNSTWNTKGIGILQYCTLYKFGSPLQYWQLQLFSHILMNYCLLDKPYFKCKCLKHNFSDWNLKILTFKGILCWRFSH